MLFLPVRNLITCTSLAPTKFIDEKRKRTEWDLRWILKKETEGVNRSVLRMCLGTLGRAVPPHPCPLPMGEGEAEPVSCQREISSPRLRPQPSTAPCRSWLNAP